MPKSPVIWALTDNQIGMRAQAQGLGQALAGISGGELHTGTVATSKWRRTLPPTMAVAMNRWAFTTPNTPMADIIIGCGQQVQKLLVGLKAKHNVFIVYVQRPAIPAKYFDIVVAPQHDYLLGRGTPKQPIPANVILTLGAVGAINPPLLAQQRTAAVARFGGYPPPYIGVLIGGDNKAYRLSAAALLQQLSNIARQSAATLLISASRRTPPALLQQGLNQFAPRHFVWDGNADNPYQAILSFADGFAVTADSVNMVSEATCSGKGVYVLPLADKSGWQAQRAERKFAQFHQSLVQRGNTRFYTNTWEFWTAPPLQETTIAAQKIWQVFGDSRAGRG